MQAKEILMDQLGSRTKLCKLRERWKKNSEIMIKIILVFYIVMAGNAHSNEITKGPKDFQWDAIKGFIKYGNPGMLAAFLGDPDLGSNDNQVSFYKKVPGIIMGKFLVGNYTKEISNHNLFCFVDYQSQPCFDNGSSYSKSVRLQDGGSQIFDLEFQVKKGAHDFLVLAVNNKDVGTHIYHRGVIFINNDDFKVDAIIKNLEEIPFKQNSLITIYQNHDQLPITDGKLKAKSDFVLHIGNGENYSMTYKILIAKWKGTELTIDSIQNIYSLKSKESILIDDLTMANDDTRIQVFVLSNPYIKLEEDNELIRKSTNLLSTRVYQITDAENKNSIDQGAR
tara:strand:+ start:9648 stop:10661 length:1014 start_codon:yes stop_codon:yes gene_type:complete